MDAQGRAATSEGHAILAAEQRKVSAYAPAIAVVSQYACVPFAIDTFGGLGPSAVAFLQRSTERVSSRRGGSGGDSYCSERRQSSHMQRVVVRALRTQSSVIRAFADSSSGDWTDPLLRADLARASRPAEHRWQPPGQPDLVHVALVC